MFEPFTDDVLATVRLSLDSTGETPPAAGTDTDSATSTRRVTATTTTTATQSFEWVVHGDETARRRVRAHITRNFRQRKAQKAQLTRVKSGSVTPSTQSDEKHDEASDEVPELMPHLFSSDDTASESPEQGLALLRTPVSGLTDPFKSMPVQLDADTHALLDHCQFSFPPSGGDH